MRLLDFALSRCALSERSKAGAMGRGLAPGAWLCLVLLVAAQSGEVRRPWFTGALANALGGAPPCSSAGADRVG